MSLEKGMISDIAESFDGSAIRYWTSASRPSQPLVLVHGWACSSEFWKFQKEDIARHYDVVLVDLAGHGESTASNRDWSMAAFARDVLEVLERIGAKQWVVAGHSMGGAVALELARLEPMRTRAVIGVDSFTYDGFYRRSAEGDISEIVKPYRGDFSSAVHNGMSGLFLPHADPALKTWICDTMARSQEAPILASLEALLRWDVDEALNEVTVPVSCISAAAFLDPAAVARLRTKLDIEGMEDVGHFLMLENPEDFNDKLLNATAPYLSPKTADS